MRMTLRVKNTAVARRAIGHYNKRGAPGQSIQWERSGQDCEVESLSFEMTDQVRIIFDAMEEGILLIDTEGVILYANDAYCSFLKRPLDQLVGQTLREIRAGAMLPDVLKSGKAVLRVPRREGSDLYFVNMYPIRRGGEIVAGLSVVTFFQQAEDLKAAIDEALRHSKLVIRRIARASASAKYTFDDIVAESPASIAVKEMARRAAATDATVFLQSESGTGKELYAQAIHNAGDRRDQVFLAINCATFNHSTLESELFGYVEGAFTGAKKGGKVGLFEAASGGTLFLDEITEIEPGLQAKILRALQERKIRPVGAVEERAVDVRVIASTNVDMSQALREGRFRADLYYRLNAFPIRIPPLRERIEDIEPLAHRLLFEFSVRCRRAIRLTPEAVSAMRSYPWPGNARELRNVLEFLSYLSEDGVIRESMLPAGMRQVLAEPTFDSSSRGTLAERVRRFERAEILRLLEENGSGVSGKRKTAQQLGISLSGLYKKLAGTEES